MFWLTPTGPNRTRLRGRIRRRRNTQWLTGNMRSANVRITSGRPRVVLTATRKCTGGAEIAITLLGYLKIAENDQAQTR